MTETCFSLSCLKSEFTINTSSGSKPALTPGQQIFQWVSHTKVMSLQDQDQNLKQQFASGICMAFFFFDKKVFSNHITNTFCNTLSLSAEDFKYFYSLFTTRNEISKRKLFKIRFGDKVLQQPSHQTGLKEVTSACRGSADPPCKKVPH